MARLAMNENLLHKGNLNNHIGVPLTLLSAKLDAEFLIVEMGAEYNRYQACTIQLSFLVGILSPGVYATQQGGGDGDARITIRGFNQRNVAVMIDRLGRHLFPQRTMDGTNPTSR
ncbi:TonB-dependent receptor plug domain-containing protein [bacterium]|nr:TonB-dependent receptor plug domain-containing protein [bacterium]